ncbi:MAG: DUF6880 family protein [Pseudomonadota bacterium]
MRAALAEIADATGDVDAFIAQQTGRSREMPAIAAQIANRLLYADRIDEAWAAIEAARERRPGWASFEWEDTRGRALDALGRPNEAQAFRWECFAQNLNTDHLRAYLKRLPVFEDMDAEERALDHALAFEDVHTALHFLAVWPALGHAARLVVDRRAELKGTHYELLTPAAELLDPAHPLAATLLRRALIDFALEHARAKRYRYAARHLEDCARIAKRIDEWTGVEPHSAYVDRLRTTHGKKSSFWALVRKVDAEP